MFLSEVTRHPAFEQRDQFRLHEAKPVRNVQADDFGRANGGTMPLLNLAALCLLHHENCIGPLNQFIRKRIFRLVLDDRRGNLKTFDIGEYLFRSRTS